MIRNITLSAIDEKETLDNGVYMKLKEMIVNGELQPGVLLVQSQLAKMLNVSRTPLRKAIGQLETEGLLMHTAKGCYVHAFTTTDMVSVFEIRAVLEGLACRFVAAKAEPADFAYMRALFQQAYQLYEQEANREAYYLADLRFHTLIIDLAKDPLLSRTVDSYRFILTSLLKGLYRDPHETYPEHLAIIEALAEKNGEHAEKLMQDHIRKAIPHIQQGEVAVPPK